MRGLATKVRAFKELDYHEFSEWFKARNLKCPNKCFLPEMGLIEPGVAAGFMIKTDCKFGILDFFVSNPDADKEKSDKTLFLIADILINSAKRAGMLAIKADSNIFVIKDRLNKLNFKYIGDTSLFVKGL